MNRVRAFQVVLCADVWDRVVVNAVQALEEAVVEQLGVVGFGGVFSEPLVVYRPRGSSPVFTEEEGGGEHWHRI